ncbi:MAG: mercuric reductase, partial [Kiloniellales bacterium]
MTEMYDAIVIGTGQSGPSLAARLAGAGQKVAIIERKRFGGTCVNNGCTPTKTLVASARAAHMARRGADFGVVIDGPIRVDMAKVKARKDAVVAKSNSGVERWLKGLDNATVYEGHGSFEGPHTLRVGDALLEAERIFINVGARAAVPPVPGIETAPTLNNSRMMELDTLPDHLVILGGGYIGLEFGQMYRRFGSKVTVVHRGSHLLSREDEDVGEAVRGILEAEGVEVLTDTGDWRVEGTDGAVSIAMRCQGETVRVAGSHLLVATGRVPNTQDLGLDQAGVETDRRGFIKVDDELRTSAPGVWAMGDCNGRGAFTHTSYNDF